MGISCADEQNAPAVLACTGLELPDEVPAETLREVVRRCGTPAYAYDLGRMRAQVARLRDQVPPAVDLFYSLKANAALGLCGFLAERGLGADVASAGEILTALEAGFAPERLLVTGTDRSPALLAQLRTLPDALVSVDSLSDLELLARRNLPNRVILRLRPDFRCTAVCTAGPDARFGLPSDELPRCREYLRAVRVVGFHVFAGSQVLDAAAVVHHLGGAVDQSLRAADVLGIVPEILDVGGGFGVPYGPGERELDLAPIGAALHRLAGRAAPGRILMELGRYLVAQAGWYLTTVLTMQRLGGRPAVVVDGGTHQRGDSCGLDLRRKAYPPAVLDGATGPRVPTDVLGCLSHPGDVLAEASLLPPLTPGQILAFATAAVCAMALGASPWQFHGHPAPAEAAFDGTTIDVIRVRREPPVHSRRTGSCCNIDPGHVERRFAVDRAISAVLRTAA